jgi:hypothetical protein
MGGQEVQDGRATTASSRQFAPASATSSCSASRARVAGTWEEGVLGSMGIGRQPYGGGGWGWWAVVLPSLSEICGGGARVEGTGRSGGEVGMVRAHMSARWFCRQNREGAEP